MIRLFQFLFAILLIGAPINTLASDDLLPDNTVIVGITDEIPQASVVRGFQGQSFELAKGEFQSFDQWYRRKSPSLFVEGFSQLDPNFGINWGVSTGEQGEKYTIDPALKFGFTFSREVTKNTDFILSGYRFFGGALKEKTCRADYGAIGGQQKVNCRLAATPLAPEETLQYLVNDQNRDWGINIAISARF